MDTDCETSDVFNAFLDLILCSKLGDSYLCGDIPAREGHLFTFLDKWDCPGVKTALCNELYFKVLDQLVCPVELFIVGARARQSALCENIIRRFPERTWEDPFGEPGVYDGVPGKPSWDPTTWPLWALEDCPSTYLWALSRAWREYQFKGRTLLYLEFSSKLKEVLKHDSQFSR